jgi:peroxiredoxin (alkyl hydroperoxide reductase subunit C)
MSCGSTSTVPTLLVKQNAPAWSGKAVVNGEIKELCSKDYKDKFQVLLFYPLDFTFVCPTELIAFSDRAKEFKDLGAEVIGISVDSEYSHLAWANTPRDKGGLSPMNIPLLSDVKKDIARRFGVLWDESVAVRGLFIIDGKGIVRHATINDLPIGRSVDEALRVVQAIQFTDKHGEVCPANWKPGQKTMKADPKGSLEYFKSINN